MNKSETKTKKKGIKLTKTNKKVTKTNKKVTKSGGSKNSSNKRTTSAKGKLKAQKEKIKELKKRLKEVAKGKIITKSEIMDGICGNCGNELGNKDKYCHLCGTKRGESDFKPVFNLSQKVYGPPMSYYYKCKKCNHKWKVETLLGKNESEYCPNCGAKQIENTKTINRLSSILKRLK